MYRAFANSRSALILRRLRGRFGMSAARVTVRAHIPWYWRAVTMGVLLTVIVVLGNLVYDFGRRYAGYDKAAAEQELITLRDRIEVLESEAERLRNIGSGSEASLQIERTAQQKLSEQVKHLESENGRLREDLAAFEKLASGDMKNESVGIHRMRVERDPAAGQGVYHYQLMLAAPASRSEREFKGRLQLIATVQQDGGIAIVNIPDGTSSSESQKFIIDFKYFHRVEGSFSLPQNADLKKLEVRLMQGPTLVASQQLIL